MRVSVALPSNWGLRNPLELVELAVLAEDLGFDAVWMGEHIFNIGYIADRLGDRPYYAPLAMLAYIAARTKRIRLGTSVIVLPNYHPATLAKFVATLDHLCAGRLILGVGCGGNRPEFEAMDLAFEDRGHVANEMLEVIRALFTQARASHHGRHWNFDDVVFSPKPLQNPFPIWVGSLSASPPSLRRTAHYGAGWQPAALTPAEFAAGAETIRTMARKAGRDGEGITMCISLTIGYDATSASSDAERQSMIVRADAPQMAQELSHWAAYGADEVLLRFNLADVERLRSEMRYLAREVVPLIH
jgi:probable F420-dependent oxidoreductase